MCWGMDGGGREKEKEKNSVRENKINNVDNVIMCPISFLKVRIFNTDFNLLKGQ